MFSENEWDSFSRDGFMRLGPLLDSNEVAALRLRADELALGKVVNPSVVLQLDTGGEYDALPSAAAVGDGTLFYRKINGLEGDDQFSKLLVHPKILAVCARQYGPHAAVSLFRAMVMNKPAGRGTVLPWHQDGGDVWALDRDPLVTVWVALDDATEANGCMDVVPGSHQLGLLSWYGSTVAEEHVEQHCRPDNVRPLPVAAGHGVLLHNWLIHRSGINPSAAPRRAFTACFLDARTRSTLTGNLFPLIHGKVIDEPPLYLRHLRDENAALRHSQATAEEYALSLEANRVDLEREIAELRLNEQG